MRLLMWRGVYLTPEDIRTDHVDPTATLSDPLSSLAAMPHPSFEASLDPAHHRRRQQRAHQTRVDLLSAIDSNQARRLQKHFLAGSENMLLTPSEIDMGMPTQLFVEGVTLIFIQS
jgi:hypothetical protein